MSVKEESYWLVRFRLKEVKAYNGNVLTQEGSLGYPVTEDGWPQIRGGGPGGFGGQHFKSKPSKKTLSAWDGMPWYCQIKSAEAVHVARKTEVVETQSEPELIGCSPIPQPTSNPYPSSPSPSDASKLTRRPRRTRRTGFIGQRSAWIARLLRRLAL